jgi:outer membrane protein OmpA-like peptidoglycan-associated protein
MRTIATCFLILTSNAGHLAAQERKAVPLRPGLTIVKAVEMTQGDSELILRVDQVTTDAVRIRWSGDITPRQETSALENPLGGLLSGIISAPSEKATPAKASSPPDEKTRLRGTRIVRRADLVSATHFYSLVSNRQPDVFPGSTMLGTSAAVLADLKGKGQTPFSCMCAPELFSGNNSLEGMISALTGATDAKVKDGGKLSGTIKRVGPGPTTLRILVNDVPTELRVIQAEGMLGDHSAEFTFLDDADNPVALRAKVGPNSSHVVKIAFPSEASVPGIAAALETKGRVDVYGIYFDIASATIRAESEVVLKEIAAALAANPSWALNVEGHTDNVGDDADNLDLSRRRAAAVKDALVKRHGITTARLATSGFGESKPKESNDSVQGRARNRRVELVRR